MDQVGDGVAPFDKSVMLNHLEHVHSLEEAANFLFLDDDVYNASDVVDRAFLSPFNARVDAFNDLMLRHLPAEKNNDSLSPLFFLLFATDSY